MKAEFGQDKESQTPLNIEAPALRTGTNNTSSSITSHTLVPKGVFITISFVDKNFEISPARKNEMLSTHKLHSYVPVFSSLNFAKVESIAGLFTQCHLDKVFYDENSISYAVMH